MAKPKLFKGGEFLIIDALPEEVFTPEDFTKEHRLIGKSAEEFGLGEIQPRREALRTRLSDLRKVAEFTPTNTIALRREIADNVIPVARYDLTKT